MTLIKSFQDKDTEKIFSGTSVRKYRAIQDAAEETLMSLHAAASLNDLAALPSHRLEKLKGNRKGQYSIRVNDQFRVCFEWKDADAYRVELVDYH